MLLLDNKNNAQVASWANHQFSHSTVLQVHKISDL